MATEYGFGKIVNDSLVLSLDAADRNSYPGTGTSWVDLSGGGRNFTTSGTFNSSNGGALSFNGSNQASDGPASNTFGIGQNFTIEFVGNLTAAGGTQWGFWFGGNGNDRGISSHLNESGEIIFDTAGGVGTNRTKYSPAPAVGTTNWYAFRYKNDATPYKHIYLNGTSVANSGANGVDSLNLSTETAQIPGSKSNIWYNGRIFLFRMYNRALTDAELISNYNSVRTRFNI